MTITDVEVKGVAPQRVLALGATSPPGAAGPDVEVLFERVVARMDDAGADRAEPISWREHGERGQQVYAGYVAATEQVPGLEAVELPAATVAAVVRRGDVATLHQAHEALERWAQSHSPATSFTPRRWRELYLQTDDADHTEWVVEVQLVLDA